MRPGILSLLIVGISLAAVRAETLSIMPLGDSITVGVDYSTKWEGGYRDPLYRTLVAAGITPQFVGTATFDATPLLTSTHNTHHNGYGAYHIQDIAANLDGVAAPLSGGDTNFGGYWLTGGHNTGRGPEKPDLILLEIGTNDFLQNVDLPHINNRITALVEKLHALCPNAKILIAGAIPVNNNPGFNFEIKAYNEYIEKTLVPAHAYTQYVDLFSAFLHPDGTTISDYFGTDNIHPNAKGYPVIAAGWAKAIEQMKPAP
jgi:hypothetical protein